MSRLYIQRDVVRLGWSVYRGGPFGRYVISFPTLLEAEQWVIEHGKGPS